MVDGKPDLCGSPGLVDVAGRTAAVLDGMYKIAHHRGAGRPPIFD